MMGETDETGVTYTDIEKDRDEPRVASGTLKYFFMLD